MDISKSLQSLTFVSPPKQARSEKTLHRLLDAAESLIAEKGVGALSIPEIVRLASSSTGSFYARFKDKDALLRTLEERFFVEIHGHLDSLLDDQRWDGVPTHEAVRALAEALTREVRRHGPLIRAFVFRALQSRGEGFQAESMRFRRRVTERLGNFLLARSGEFDHPDLDVATHFAISAAFACVQAEILASGNTFASRDPAQDAQVNEMVRAFLAYLGYRRIDRQRA